MKTIRNIIVVAILLTGGVVVASDHTVLAQAGDIQRGVNDVGGAGALSFETALQNIINVFLFLIGAISVVMIIYGGFRYVTSGGDASAVKSAKDTILYAVIGLVVAALAYSIVTFVIGIVDGSDTSGTENSSNTSPRDPRYDLSPDDPNYIGPTP